MSPSSYAPNLHEGSRSEYLAQYVFSMFGTSVPVLHQEDYGLDLRGAGQGRVPFPPAHSQRPVGESARDAAVLPTIRREASPAVAAQA